MKDPASPSNKFTWGDAVIVKKEAPLHLYPGRMASICSVIKVLGENTSTQYHDGDLPWFYTIEFGDGSSIDIDEQFLDKLEEDPEDP